MSASSPSPELGAINEMLASVDLSAMTLDEQRASIEHPPEQRDPSH